MTHASVSAPEKAPEQPYSDVPVAPPLDRPIPALEPSSGLITEDMIVKAAPVKEFSCVEDEAEVQQAQAVIDLVNHPAHYQDRVPGIECIEVTRWFDFDCGNAIKYIWRAGLKGDTLEQHVQDLEKAIWYLQDEISMLKGQP